MSASESKNAVKDIIYNRYRHGEWQEVSAAVPREMSLTIYVNGEELLSILCTPLKLNCLVIGFLYLEGIISNVGEIASMRICEEESLADVRLTKSAPIPLRRSLTSGCGSAITFGDGRDIPKIDSDLTVIPSTVLLLMKYLHDRAELYRLYGGVHTSALGKGESLLVVAEDIGRHNTIDKIQGECLLRKVATRDCLLLTTGRLSSEMLTKTAKMGVPIMVSRSSASERAISLAELAGITIIGYARGDQLIVYTHPSRIRVT